MPYGGTLLDETLNCCRLLQLTKHRFHDRKTGNDEIAFRSKNAYGRLRAGGTEQSSRNVVLGTIFGERVRGVTPPIRG